MENLITDQELVICSDVVAASSARTGRVFDGTWGGNQKVRVRKISDIDVRKKGDFEKYVSPLFAHENVLKVFGSFLNSRDRAHRYFVLEHFDPTLQQYCQNVEIQESLYVMPADIDALRQMAEGLLFIHGKDLLHGSINPDNVFVCTNRDTLGLLVKISDFGLHVAMTAVENRIQSYHWHPKYWLPEEPHEIEPSVYGADFGPDTVKIPESFYNDVFALGCTMFYFLKRQHPFLGPLENDNDPLQQILHNIRIQNAAGLSMLPEGENHVAYKPINEMVNNSLEQYTPEESIRRIGRPHLLIAAIIFKAYLADHPLQ